MNTNSIGTQIINLRKQRGITQETLAEAVGVTGQAVSKWESGGSPDTQLLPAIADYFGVSIDHLFARQARDTNDLQKEVALSLRTLPDKDAMFEKAYEFCWTMFQAIGSNRDVEDFEKLDKQKCDIALNISDDSPKPESSLHSGIYTDAGAIQIRMNNNKRYCLMIPKSENAWHQQDRLKKEYVKLFKALGDEDVLKTLFFLNARKNNKPFTPKFLAKELDFSLEKSTEIITKLEERDLLFTREVEYDDEIRKTYVFSPNFSIIPLLAFAEEIIFRPNNWWICHDYSS